MKRISFIVIFLFIILVILQPVAYAKSKEINPKRLYALGENWLGRDDNKVAEKIKSIGYVEDFSVPVLNGHIYFNNEVSLDHIAIRYDEKSKKVNNIAYSYKASPEIFTDIYESIEENIGNATYTATSIIWETNTITYELTASFLEESSDSISLFELQLGKKDFVLYVTKAENNTVKNLSTKNPQKTNTPTSTPKPTQMATAKIGTNITTPFVVIFLEKYEKIDKLQFSEKETGYLQVGLSKTKTNSKYIAIKGKIKNTGNVSFTLLNSIGGKVIIDGLEYEVGIFSPSFFIEPYDTYPIYLYALVPNEIAKNFKSCVFQIGFDDSLGNDSIFTKAFEEYDYRYEIKIQ